MKKFCGKCGMEVETEVVIKNEIYEIYGEEIEVEAEVLTCRVCGEELFCEELDNATLVKAYNFYRQKHKYLLPEEIKMIREKYGLSQRAFAKLLNWGDKTIRRYEQGSLQDKAHNSLLLFLREPNNMKTYLLENEVGLDSVQLEKLLQRIKELEVGDSAGTKSIRSIFSYEPCINNGFRSFEYEKFCAMVLFFARRCQGLLKVKLLKLLNYSDMVFYKENGISISGTQYVHLPYGPVPQHYDVLFGMMEAEKLMHIDVQFDNGYERHQVIAECENYSDILSNEELEVLERVYHKFADFGSVEISNYSHNEEGYKNTVKGEVISYAYAKDIVL